MNLPDLTDEQDTVKQQALAFLRDPNPRRPYFLFEGLAGTGKSVLLAHLAHQLGGKSLLCAFTGKAASVIARKTGMGATTIHSAIYQFMGEDDETADLKFEMKIDDWSWQGHTALVDESGTINEALAQDLLRTGCRAICCGDPGQLPPVQGDRFFTGPDAALETVHRQAWDSPIIRQAHAVRGGRDYAADGDDFRVQRHVDAEDILAADIILCWRNATRSYLNGLARTHRGISGPVRAGEPLMCLKNDHRRGILNGAVYPSLYDRRPWDPIVVNNERGEEVEIPGRIEDLEPASYERGDIPWALAYCATVHKFQGSEADFVVLADEYDRRDFRREWLYTAMTRAAKRILIQRGF